MAIQSKLNKIREAREYILFGLIVNYPKPFIISRNNNKLRNLGISYPIFIKQLKLSIQKGETLLTPGNFYKSPSGKKTSKSTGCMLNIGPAFVRSKILSEISWSQKYNMWFPNVKDKINSSSGNMKLRIPMFEVFIGQLNELNRKHEFTIGSEPLNVELTRLRSSGTNLRIYSRHGFQKLPKKNRSEIKIDDRATCEIDIKACHLSIMIRWLSEKGRSPKVTNFDIDDYRYSRERIKRVFYTCVNARTIRVAKKTIQKRYKMEQAALDLLFSFVLSYFNEYSDYLFNPVIWKKLHEEEALICDQVLRNCLDHNIPIIPIFDSFIVRKEDRNFLLHSIESLGLEPSYQEEV